MFCSKLPAIVILTLCKTSTSNDTRRSLNIFNRTSVVRTSNASGNSSALLFKLTNATSDGGYEEQDETDKTEKSREEATDMIMTKRRRRLGVGAKSKRPSDDFIDGNESMHRFFDKMIMSMTTEVSFLINPKLGI